MDPKYMFRNLNPDIRDFSEQVEAFLEKREIVKLRVHFFEKITILIISAFGLIAALAWDEALKSFFASVFGGLTELQEKFFYAVSITILAVIISIVLTRLFIKKED